ncbi:MAG TPA: hypothetical protein GXZ90_05780 [Clostridiales bacterium]|nr:hypothetical protein [Clostridiales bacterium]
MKENNYIEPHDKKDYISIKGATIDDKMFYNGSCFILISYWTFHDNMCINNTIRLVVNNDTIIHDEYGRRNSFCDLKINMIVDVDISVFMTMSIPPQAIAYRVIIQCN